jgi:hypothetical protein
MVATYIQQEKRKTDEDIGRAKPQWTVMEAAGQKFKEWFSTGGKLTTEKVREYRALVDREIQRVNKAFKDHYEDVLYDSRANDSGVPTEHIARMYNKPAQIGGELSDEAWLEIIDTVKPKYKEPGFEKARAKRIKQERLESLRQKQESGPKSKQDRYAELDRKIKAARAKREAEKKKKKTVM